MYIEQCAFYDNGRLKTWLPYQRNQDSSALVHDISQETLLGDQVDKYYVNWYKGPQVIINVIFSFLLVNINCLFNGRPARCV